jgi:hypothetical protein
MDDRYTYCYHAIYEGYAACPRPIDQAETPYTFITVEQLLDDFERDVAHWSPAS